MTYDRVQSWRATGSLWSADRRCGDVSASSIGDGPGRMPFLMGAAAWWRRQKWLRKRFAMQRGLCAICGDPMQHPRFKPFDRIWSATIDHIIPLSKGGPDVWENVRAAHCACNGHKADATDGQVGERLKPPDCKSGPDRARWFESSPVHQS